MNLFCGQAALQGVNFYGREFLATPASLEHYSSRDVTVLLRTIQYNTIICNELAVNRRAEFEARGSRQRGRWRGVPRTQQ